MGRRPRRPARRAGRRLPNRGPGSPRAPGKAAASLGAGRAPDPCPSDPRPAPGHTPSRPFSRQGRGCGGPARPSPPGLKAQADGGGAQTAATGRARRGAAGAAASEPRGRAAGPRRGAARRASRTFWEPSLGPLSGGRPTPVPRAPAGGVGGGAGRGARGSHLGRVAEEAESEAAAFELHLQRGAPGHRDPAPVVSGEHAGGSARVPAPCSARAARLCPFPGLWSLDARPPVPPGSSRGGFPNSAPGDGTWARQGAAPSSATPAEGPRGAAGLEAPSQPLGGRPGPAARLPGRPSRGERGAGSAVLARGGRGPHTCARGGPREAPPRPARRPHLAVPTTRARKTPPRPGRRGARGSAGRTLGPRPVSPLSSFGSDAFNFLQSQIFLLWPLF